MSQADAQRFAALLTAALYQIKQREALPIAVIQDEIGYAMGRKGGSVVESWRKGGHMPQRKADVERLAAILVERGKLSREWLEEYLGVCGYGSERAALCERLLPSANSDMIGEPGAAQGPPFQAPAPVAHFVGRGRELDAVCARLREGPGPRLAALTGMGGVGKTTLATHAAHSLRTLFADGVLWADAATGSPLHIVEQWARSYGYDLSGVHDLQNRAAALRGLLAQKQVLLVLDDVQQAGDVAALLPGGEQCAVLLTTRNEEVAAALSAAVLPLDELPLADSLALLSAILGSERLFVEQDAARRICRQLQYLPLALEIVGQLLKTRPNRRLLDMAAHLETLDHRLNLRISDRAVRTSFAASWTALDEPHRLAFACLGVFEGRTLSAEALAHVAGLDLYTAEERLYTLKALSLLREPAPNRFQQHPLLAGFAREQLGEAPAAYERMARYYAAFADGRRDDDDALEEEWENITAAMQTAHRFEQWSLLLGLGSALTEHWFRRAHFTEARTGHALMYAAAAALGDVQQQAFARHKWGWACLEQDDYDEAAEHLQASLGLFVAGGDEAGEAEAHYGLARMALERAQYASAQEHIAAYRDLCERRGDETGLARACHQQAFHAYLTGDLPRTRALCEQATALFLRQADNPDILPTLRLLADVAIEEQRYEDAEGYCREALATAQRLQNQGEIVAVYYSMTVVARMQQRLALALDYSSTALERFEKMGDQGFIALVLYEQSRIYFLQGEPHAAQRAAERSAALFRSLGDRFNLVYVLNHLGAVHLALGRGAAACNACREAVAVATALDHPWLEAFRQRLAEAEALASQGAV